MGYRIEEVYGVEKVFDRAQGKYIEVELVVGHRYFMMIHGVERQVDIQGRLVA